MINNFEKKYNVKIKYSVYDSNEILYNKLYTTHYDIMVPSDYMINKLAQEGRLEEIDYKKLNEVDKKLNIIKPNSNYYGQDAKERILGNKYFNNLNIDIDKVQKINSEFYYNCIIPSYLNPNISKCFDKKYALSLSNGLLNILNKNKLKNNINKNKQNNIDQKTITNYSLPYFWGEISLVINPTESNLKFLNNIFLEENKKLPSTSQGKFGYKRTKWNININYDQIKINDVKNNNIISNGISWDILWKAASKNKRVLINNDPKNLFMLTSQKKYFKSSPTTKVEVNYGYSELIELLKHNNVSLMNDELINAVGDGNFDFAFMYNGDAIYADTLFINNHKKYINTKLIITRLRATKDWTPETIEGTNIWSDNMVLSKNSKNKDLAYKFMNFIIQNSSILTEETKYTSPYQQVIDYENNYNYYYNNINDLKSGAMFDYSRYYIPVSKINNKKIYISKPEMSDGPFEITDLDGYILKKYNILIAGKN